MAAITIEGCPALMPIGTSAQLAGTSRDAAGLAIPSIDLVWTSTNRSVASVTVGALLTAHSYGLTAVVASLGSVAGRCTIRVASRIVSVTVQPPQTTLAQGATQSLTAVARDSSGNAIVNPIVTWASSSVSIASVSGGGLVTALGSGFARITATIEGVTGGMDLTVN